MTRTLVVVSHPNVVAMNQLVYVELAKRGWDLRLVVPNRWADDYSPRGFTPEPVDGLTGVFRRVRVARPGAIQRHFYVTRPARHLREWRPDALFLEQEPFSVPALQWGAVAERLGIPWGVQGDENLDRPFPWPAKVIRALVTPRAHFFAARSPTAGHMLERWGARAPIEVVPHTLPGWRLPDREPGDGPFTVGYAGRLVEEKGIRDLLDASKLLDREHRLLVVGDGPLRGEVEQAGVEVRTGLRGAAMQAAYREMDVLVLPSRTTPTWAEQFGRVLGEALLCGVPVVGADSGEIPWVIATTQGGRTFPEGDAAALARTLRELYDAPSERRELARRGREGVRRHFTPDVAAEALDHLLRRVVR